MSKKRVVKRALTVAANVFIYIFLIVCLICVTLTLTAKKSDDGTSTLFGYQMRYVLSPSMEKCDATYDTIKGYDIKDIPTKSMVFVEVIPEEPEAAMKWYEDLEIGDVLTFKYVYVRQETITHRITDKYLKPDGSGYIISLAGDNKDSDSENLTQVIDTSIPESPNYVIGKVVGQNYALGLLVHTLKTPVGMVCIIIVPALIILLVELVKVINLFSSGKRKKEEEIREAQKSEIEELKRRLAEIEAMKKSSDTDAVAESDAVDEPDAVAELDAEEKTVLIEGESESATDE